MQFGIYVAFDECFYQYTVHRDQKDALGQFVFRKKIKPGKML